MRSWRPARFQPDRPREGLDFSYAAQAKDNMSLAETSR